MKPRLYSRTTDRDWTVCHETIAVMSNFIRRNGLTRCRIRANTTTIEPREEAPMGTVMIRCPATGTAIPTGIKADRASYLRTPVFMARAYCPICRTEHEWFAKDAWVADAREEMSPQAA